MSSLLAVGGCVDLFATTSEGASTGAPTPGAPVTTTTTSPPTTTTSGEPPGTTTPAPTTTSGEPWTTGTGETSTGGDPPGPPPVQRCQLLPAPDLRDAACAGAPDCRIRAAQRHGPYDRTLTWVKDTYFDIFCLCDECRCQAQTQLTVDEPCELVASVVAPDPDAPDTLLRTELWRRTLGFDRADLDIDAVVRDGTLWLLSKATSPTEEIVVWAVDTE